MKKCLALILCLVMVLCSLFTVCAEESAVSGNVSIAVYPDEEELYNYVFSSSYFIEKYPGIHVTVIPWVSESNEWLTTQAANNTLPDIMLDWKDVTYPVSQGWVYPLTAFLEQDPESAWIPENLADKYVYGGETYAVPYRYSLRTFAINTDMLDELNMDAPEYTWDIDMFKDLLIEATSSTTSGMNYIGWMEDAFLASMSPDGFGAWAYDKENNRVNLTDGNFVIASNLIKELEGIPGLCADNLVDAMLTAFGKPDDYSKKFGDGVDAVGAGKVLVTNTSTWDYSWFKNYTFAFDFYPIPGRSGEEPNIITYTDHAFITSTCKAPEAAYEVLKFVTFGDGGYQALLDHSEAQRAEGADPDMWLPMSKCPAQLEAFAKVDYVAPGVKWMFDHMDSAVVGDYNKCIPGMTVCIEDYLNPAIDEIHTGTSDAEAIMIETEQMANNYLRESADIFNAQLLKVQQEFKLDH